MLQNSENFLPGPDAAFRHEAHITAVNAILQSHRNLRRPSAVLNALTIKLQQKLALSHNLILHNTGTAELLQQLLLGISCPNVKLCSKLGAEEEFIACRINPGDFSPGRRI